MAARTEDKERQTDRSAVEFHREPSRFTRALDEVGSPVPENTETLGSKGLGLVEATRLGLPVPPGIIVTTDAWCEFHAAGDVLPENIWQEIEEQIHHLEEKSDRELGNPQKPLFVSVRSGAPVSMPGVMHTILNIGLNDKTVEILAQEIGEHGAWEAYFNFVVDMGVHVYGVDPQILENIRTRYTFGLGVTEVNELPISTIQNMVRQALAEVKTAGHEIPAQPHQQIKEAVRAVFASWESLDAQAYRERFGISEELGTAAIIQQMVWGNSLEKDAGSGVLFTRDPKTLGGAVAVFAPRAQGPKVVGPTAHQEQTPLTAMSIQEAVQKQLQKIGRVLETYYKKPQEVEFTFDGDRLWLLQTRDVPLANVAWFRLLQEKITQGEMDLHKAQHLIPVAQLQSLLAPGLDHREVVAAHADGRLAAIGIPISLGTATGEAVRSVAEALKHPDQKLILTANITMEDLTRLPENIVGIVAENGSIGSHIARVATRVGTRGMPIIFGAEIPERPTNGTIITLDGTTGEVFYGSIPLVTNGNNLLLTEEERATAQAWLDSRCANPWRFAGVEAGIEALTTFAQDTLTWARMDFSSLKAHATHVINGLIPAEIRMDYTIIKATDRQNLQTLLKNIIRRGSHATVRTCYTPDRRGRAPWALITSGEDIADFLENFTYGRNDSRYGGYPRWLAEPDLTEILVGEIPKDKLNPDPAIQHQHCAWTLTATEAGDILLQVRPFSAQLRGHEQTTDDDLISFTAKYSSRDPSGLEIIQTKIGNNLENDPEAQSLANFVAETVFGGWWKSHQLPQRMAAAAEVFPKPNFPTPVLEGQARLNPHGRSWYLIYGMKIDIAEEET
ncbi:MAG: PEP/pyruvate-binding domain-containing protein [Patescibacteria group bacterium]